jgi:hypothetical protein
MPSAVDICNMSLSHLGAESVVASIAPPDGSVEAGHCARFYPIARREALEAGAWTWAKTRATLAPVFNPSRTWAYAYALPSDCLSPKRVLQQTTVLDFPAWWTSAAYVSADEVSFWTERGSADFEVENGVLLTHEPDAVLLYTRDVTDTTKFSTQFGVYLSFLLASYLAGPIIKGQAGTGAALNLRKLAAEMKGAAASDDANGSAERADFIPEHLRSR